VGGAYPLKDWSTVIIRTKAGEDFFFDAVENGVISTWVIEEEPEVMERVMIAATNKRNTALEEAKKLEEAYGYLPVRMLRESEELAKIKVEDIMTRDIKTVEEDVSVGEFLELIAKDHHVGYPVVNKKGEPIGVATLEEAAKIGESRRKITVVGEITKQQIVSAFPGETALDAFRKMEKYEVGRVIVLDPANPKIMLGIITKTDLMHILTNNAPKP
jgi:CBS domain-containing protein